MTANHIGTLRIKRSSLSDQVADQIQHLIIKGGLKPGDKLPPERELAEQLGVSRTVIREATKTLQERGLVRVLTGSGTYATKVEPELVSQSIGLYVRGHRHAFRDLLEIRKSLEVGIAGLAAQRANQTHVEQLEAALQEMQAVLPRVHDLAASLEQFVRSDVLFHRILAEASGNSLLPLLLTPITDLLAEFSREASSLPGAPESAVHYHQIVLECVRAHDEARCRQVMHDHMSHAEELIELMEAGKWDTDLSVLGGGLQRGSVDPT